MKREVLASLFIAAALTPSADARNPFEFGADTATESDRHDTPRLTLLMVNGERTVAMIDGVIVSVGDVTNYGDVTGIDTTGVVITRPDGSLMTLRLSKDRP